MVRFGGRRSLCRRLACLGRRIGFGGRGSDGGFDGPPSKANTQRGAWRRFIGPADDGAVVDALGEGVAAREDAERREGIQAPR